MNKNVLGLASTELKLYPHSSQWTALFEQEAKLLRAAIGNDVLDIQHVGSTAIPSIPAKPILDIAVAVENFEEASRCIQPLEALGYTYKGENGIPRRHYFVKESGAAKTHHLHMNEVHGSDWQQQISFRDHLRQHPALAQEYAALKLRLAAQFPTDRIAYTEGKSGFISRALNHALPELLPKVGDTLLVRAYKRNNSLYRQWAASVEAVDDEKIVTFASAGTPISDFGKGDWISQHAIRTYYWFDRPYNLLEVYRPNGELEEIYVHVASPMVVKNGEILYTDYELDVVKPTGDIARIIDEDEFAEAAVRYGYSDEFCEFCRSNAQELLDFVSRWQTEEILNFVQQSNYLERFDK